MSTDETPAAPPADSSAPRYEVRVDPTPASPPRNNTLRRITARGVIAVLTVLALAVWSPYGFGVSIVLPALFAYVGLRVAASWPRALAYTLRFFDDVLEIEGDGYLARTPWEHISLAKETAAGVSIETPGGRSISIPIAQVPADRRVLIDAMPAHVRFEVVPPAPAPKSNTRKTLALWLVLIALFYAIYQIMGAR